MKKYLLLIPLFAFPYIYLPHLAVLFGAPYLSDVLTTQYGLSELSDSVTTVWVDIWFILPVIYTAITLIFSIIHTIFCTKGKYDAYTSAKLNMIVRCVHIPAYIFHFIMGVIGALMSVFGLGFLIFAILIDLLTIILTGISSIGVNVRIAKEKVFPIWAAILMGIGSFVYIADVVIAFVYFFKARKASKQTVSELPGV